LKPPRTFNGQARVPETRARAAALLDDPIQVLEDDLVRSPVTERPSLVWLRSG
jgi:hypothetical protein